MYYVFAALVTTIVVFVLASYVSSAVFTVCKSSGYSLDSNALTIALFGLAITPFLITVISLFSFVYPELASFFSHYQHCHGQFCGPHKPIEIAHNDWNSAILVTFIAGVAIPFTMTYSYIYRTEKRVAALRKLAGVDITEKMLRSYCVIEHATPIVFSAGWLRPMVFVSTKAMTRLSPTELSHRLAHEYISIIYNERAQKIVLRKFSFAWPSATRRSLNLAFAQALNERRQSLVNLVLTTRPTNRSNDIGPTSQKSKAFIYLVVLMLGVYTWSVSAILTNTLHWLVERA